jgi:hypothetical protein
MHQQEIQLGKAQTPSQNSTEFFQGCSRIQRFVGYKKLYNYKVFNGGVLPYRYIMTTTIKYGFFMSIAFGQGELITYMVTSLSSMRAS